MAQGRMDYPAILRPPELTPRVVESLYVEAMVLADEARAFFQRGHEPQLDGLAGVGWSCESLKVTTRLMHCIAWLLSMKADMSTVEGNALRARPLGHAPLPDPELLIPVSEEARDLVRATEELYGRLHRLNDRIEAPTRAAMGARALIERVQGAY